MGYQQRFLKFSSLLSPMVTIACLLSLLSPCWSQSSEVGCEALRDKWEQIFRNLKDTLDQIDQIQNTPVERIIRRPLVVQGPQTKTVARQISEALQIKEDMINEKRKACRELLELEEQAFGPYRDCLNDLRGAGKKEVEKVAKRRRSLLDKSVVALAEVREVEGRDTVTPYSQAWRGQDFYPRGGWPGYGYGPQPQYRGGWWGY